MRLSKLPFRSFLILLPMWFCVSDGYAQHDAQRNAMQALATGSEEGFTKAFLNPKVDAGEAESLFVGMLKLLAEDKVGDAIEVAREALAKGIPPGRFFAGPLQLTSRLRDHEDFQRLPGIAEVGPIIHGPMLGDVTDHSAKVWVRTKGPGTYHLIVAEKSKEAVNTERITFSKENHFTGVFEIGNLTPDTEVTCFIRSDDVAFFPGEEAMTFRTRPAPGTASKFKVAFGGGAGFVPEWEYMWNTIREVRPDALLMLGDNVYIDQPEYLQTHDYCYSRRQSRPEWRHLIREVPVYSIYDDHDFAVNDCVPGPGIEEPSWKRAVWNKFRENWANPGYGGGEKQPGCWYDFAIGDVQFFMLDGRYYRDLEGGSMLGPVQKEWLLKGLENSRAMFKVVVSPVPFTPDIKPGSLDPWDGFPAEREEIFSHIENHRIDGVFLVCADRHRTDLRKTERPNGYTLYEFESSRLTNKHVHSVVKTEGLVWGYNEKCSFGLMEFDTTQEDPQVRFRAIDIDGEEQGNFVLKASDLQRP